MTNAATSETSDMPDGALPTAAGPNGGGTRDEAFPDAASRASERIAAALIARINQGALVVGEPLPTERALCETYDASRPTIREAVSLMQLRGYVSLGGGKRPRVARPSLNQVLVSAAEHIREILGDAESGAHLEQMRQFIEAGAVRGAAENATNIQITKMKIALEANFASIGTPGFPRTDIAFHRAIVSVIGNPIILKLHDLFVESMLAHRPPMPDRRAHDELVYEEHRQIYLSILNNDVASASSQIDAHLARSYRSRLAAPQTAEPHGKTGQGP